MGLHVYIYIGLAATQQYRMAKIRAVFTFQENDVITLRKDAHLAHNVNSLNPGGRIVLMSFLKMRVGVFIYHWTKKPLSTR